LAHTSPGLDTASGRIYDLKTGNVALETWCIDGKIDRADGKPSIVQHDPATGKVIYEEWRKGDKLERADGQPPVVGHDAKTGNITYEAWCNDDCDWPGGTPYPSGMVTRPDGATRIGRLDRADGPALILHDPATGAVTGEEWSKGGKLDRADGPAVIVRDAVTGKVTREEWWKDGQQITSPSAIAKTAQAPQP
jgi:hypothetical protein